MATHFFHRHYETLAKVIREQHERFPADEDAMREISLTLSVIFAADNEHFNRGRWLKACGFDPLDLGS